MSRRLLFVVFVVLLITGSVSATPDTPLNSTATPQLMAAAQSAVTDEAPADDAKQLVVRDAGGFTGRWVVEFSDSVNPKIAADAVTAEERPAAVMEVLQAAATASQAAVVDLVESIAGATIETHWISNAAIVDADPSVIDRIRSMPGVEKVRPERNIPMLEPVSRAPVEGAVVDVPWGVDRVQAPAVWDLGVFGGGVVVGSLDSGVEYDHPALVDSYRGNLGGGVFDHNYNWFDGSRDCPDPGVPCDLLGHGTHTMGTMVGGDGPGPFAPDVGVAPNAQWMLASCGPGFCTEGQLMTVGEWFIAPTDVNGENPDPSKAPHVINNSWGGPPGDPFFEDFVEAWRAAGIIPVFAAGNPGPGCGDGGSPGDYLAAFSVGATDINDVIADFSGRGPSAFGKINPDVSAPGVDVLSSVPGQGYEFFNGTSMATPHVVGALALLMSSTPDLIGDVDSSTGLIRQTALDIIDLTCGGEPDGDPNNVYGDGRIDALNAVLVASTGGTLRGTITDAGTGDPIGGAKVTVTGPLNSSATTAPDGTYSLLLAAGTYVVTADAFGYKASVAPGVEVVTDITTTQDFALDLLPTHTLWGKVQTAEAGDPVAGARVEVVGTPVPPVFSDENGRYTLTLPVGRYTIRASGGPCLETAERKVLVNRDRRFTLRLATKLDLSGHGCMPIPFEWMEAANQSSLFGDDTVGRLDLPFPFPFYGDTYERVFITSNGYVDFTDETGEFSPFFNSAIPNRESPNAAIYALWQDLIVDDASRVDYDLFEHDGLQVFVIEYNDIRNLFGAARTDMQIKLWEDGTIDLLYGEGIDGFGGGNAATIGIENASGTDALQLGFRNRVVQPFTAYRIKMLPVGTIAGTVTNANDGSPVPGATISLTPGDRSTKTDPDGNYAIVAVPGRYGVHASAKDYAPETKRTRVRVDRTSVVDFSLQAAQIVVSPTGIAAEAEFGVPTEAILNIANTGTQPLEWNIRERDEGSTPPILPDPAALLSEDGEPFIRSAGWEPFELPAAVVEAARAETSGYAETYAAELDLIIDDPDDDAVGAVEILAVSAGADEMEMSMAIEFASSPEGELGGFVYLDTDQDPGTGLPAEALSGLPTQDVGMEFFLDMFSAGFGSVFVIDANTFEFVGEVPSFIDGNVLSFDVPLAMLGGDDGEINTAMVLGDFFGPTDWAPNEGHGEIAGARDAPWMEVDPVAGTVLPGDSTDVVVTLGGDGIQSGFYMGTLRVGSNDPVQSRVDVPVTLNIPLPPGFGGIAGSVADSETLEPLAATVAVMDGDAVIAETVADSDGQYFVTVPAGDWQMEVRMADYLASIRPVTVVDGDITVEDFLLERAAPEILIEGDFAEFIVPPGGIETGMLTISNTGTGLLEWSILEREVFFGDPTLQPVAVDGSPYTWQPDARPEVDDHLRSQVSSAEFTQASTLIIEDPPGDAPGPADIVAVLADLEPGALVITMEFADGTPVGEIQGFIGLDIDQNPGTGLPPQELEGSPDNDIGMEFFVDVFTPEGLGFVVDANEFILVAQVGLDIVGNSVTLAIPTDVLGEPMALNLAAWFQGFEPPGFDFAPDVGHGTVMGFADVPWVSADPSEGAVEAGDADTVVVTVDATGLEPGVYAAELVVLSNSVNLPSFPVPIFMEVVPAEG